MQLLHYFSKSDYKSNHHHQRLEKRSKDYPSTLSGYHMITKKTAWWTFESPPLKPPRPALPVHALDILGKLLGTSTHNSFLPSRQDSLEQSSVMVTEPGSLFFFPFQIFTRHIELLGRVGFVSNERAFWVESTMDSSLQSISSIVFLYKRTNCSVVILPCFVAILPCFVVYQIFWFWLSYCKKVFW